MIVWTGAGHLPAESPRLAGVRRLASWILLLIGMVLLGFIVAMLLPRTPRVADTPKPVMSADQVPASDTSIPAPFPCAPPGEPPRTSTPPLQPETSGTPTRLPPPSSPRDPTGGSPRRDAPPAASNGGGDFGDSFFGGGSFSGGTDFNSAGGQSSVGGSSVGGSTDGGVPTDPGGGSSGTTTTGGPVGGGDDGAAVDCNGDQVNDALQVAQCILLDVDLNGIPDCCDEGVPCPTNVLTNGGFESGPVAICGRTCVDAPAAVAASWSSTSGTLAIGRSDSGCAGRTFEAPHGARCIEVGTACGAAGALSQSVELPSASTLRLRFRATCGSGAQPVFVRVGIADQVFVDRVDCPTDDGPWALFDHAVPSASGVVAVTVSTEGAGSASGAWIDDLFLDVDPVECPSDIDGEGTVGESDLEIIFGAWSSNGDSCGCDLDTNGIVDGADLGILMAAWGSCG